MKVKEIFDKAENGTLTWAQFEKAMKDAKANFVDVAEGEYVSKHKYDDDISAKDTQITALNDTISKRDKDLGELKTKLKDAGTDATKLATLTTDFDNLKTKYENDVKDYQTKLSKQAYEFAVKEFAGNKKFTSNAAKRDFIQSMIAKELKFENNTILGAEDFVTMYSKDNADAFVVEDNQQQQQQQPPKPTFSGDTPGVGNTNDANGGFNFNFTPIRPVPNQK